jgi:tetratricopeptide (TPR) repeat protein
LSKANTIRKKALEHARRQDWESAIHEYRRLAEIDLSNPNIHNELGDIYLKVGNKTDAYESFARAVDAYTRVSLYNNAVAVCKKVLRIIPARYEMQAKLGCIRKRQGLGKEAESYCLQYLERLSQDAEADAKEVARTAESIADAMDDCAVVLDRLAELLVNMGVDNEAAQALVRLHKLYDGEGITDARDAVRGRLESMGMQHLIEEATEASTGPTKEGPVITEENIWTDSHSDGQRIVVDDAPTVAPAPPSDEEDAAAVQPEDENAYEFRTVSLSDSESAAEEPSPAAATPLPLEETEEKEPSTPADTETIHISAIIDGSDDSSADAVDGEDFRSHYDLGMAYLEMNLFSEAVREYQLASKSREFQAKSLEMIGLCFLKQNQANLAIKQLSRGLKQIDENDSGSLGIKYNLGLAYEMVGDEEKAQALFEDVYVVDISFRDVAEKIARYSKS